MVPEYKEGKTFYYLKLPKREGYHTGPHRRLHQGKGNC